MATQLSRVVFPTGDYIEDTNTDTKVTQTATTTNADYRVLFSGTADDTTRTEGARKDDNLRYNPSSNRLELINTGTSTSITPSSISLSNSGGGSISIDNTNNQIEVGKSGTSITYSNTDVVTSNGNTWDGTNTSLKTSIINAGKTKVIQGILRDSSSFDDLLIPLDTVFEDGYEYIIEVEAQRDYETTAFYKGAILRFRLESIIVNDNTGGDGDKVTYYFSCSNAPSNYLLPEVEDYNGMCNYYSYVKFSTLNGSPLETYTKDGVTYWWNDTYIKQTSSNYKLNSLCDSLDRDKLSLSGGTMTGAITMPDAFWYDQDNKYGLNMKNSDIINANGIYFGDATDSNGEGINFYRDATHYDTLFDSNGWLKVNEYRTFGSSTNVNTFTIPYGIQPIKFAAGTVVRTIPATTAYTLFNASQMKDLLKTTVTVNAANCVVWVMNGDDAAQSGRDITANYWNGTNLNVRFRTTTTAGAYRFNYLIAFWG